MLPFWLALAASLLLHAGVLLAPGWLLPSIEEPLRLDASLVAVSPPVSEVPKAAPAAAKKRPTPRRASSPPKAVQTPDKAADISAAAAEASDTSSVSALPESLPDDAETILPATSASAAAEDAVSPAQSFVSRWPRRGRILYQVTRGQQGFIIGQTEQRWEWNDAYYELQTVAETTGLVALFRPAKVIQTSRGVFDAYGVRPQEFVIEREGRDSESLRFAPDDGKIVFPRGDSVPFVAGTQDLLSVFFHLASLPLDAPEYFVNIATVRKLAGYHVTVDAPSQLDTTLGMRTVQRLAVLGRPGEDVTEFWLDTETRLPLKIRYRDRKGDVFEQIVLEIETDDTQNLPR